MNFLIEGDNLAALKLLEKTHRGKIDLIYIDPPYNTGNKDFMYNDCYVDMNDSFRHSKWISFMEKRLRVCRNIMDEAGIIFISINDCELATLRLLCDEIFGEKNFIGQLTWEATTQPINAGKARFQLQKKVESILCFARNKLRKEQFLLKENIEEAPQYPHIGKFGKCRFEIIEKSDAGAYKRDTMKFKILGQYPRNGKRWQIGEETARELERLGKLEIVNGIVKRAIYPEDEIDKKKFVPFWSHFSAKEVGTAETGKDELNDIMGRNIGFDTVKPIALITELISHFSSSSTILDFFAGSGTTGHAVMKLNSEDGGKRKFILVTNNENGICEKVTYERLKRVINKEKYAAKLKYFKVDYVPITEEGYWERAEELLKYIRELVELENGIDFVHDKSVAILLTDEEAVALLKDKKRLSVCKTVYRGHNVMFSAKMNAQLSDCGIEIRMIPDYYYPELED
ncbi:MAG: site-specific DNA-methyltransferase [Kiritimatiellae bacterium]|nr:site-specific DNA-methyltransferase [Kiritimatiellia bacterium]